MNRPPSISSQPDSRPLLQRPGLWLALATALCALELFVFLRYRHVNLDEGWYLWAARLVYQGELLYRDFAYTQTPLLPYVYGLSQFLFGEGLLPGRIVTVLFALGAWWLSGLSAARLGGPRAQVICLLLLATSFYAAAYYVYTATYALAALWLVAAVYTALPPLAGREWRRNLLATVFAVCAVATRLSVLAALPPFLLYLVLSSRQRGQALLAVATGGAAVFVVAVGPFLLLSPDQMLFGILAFHTEGALGFASHLGRMAAVLGTSVLDFLVPLGLGLAAVLSGLWRDRKGEAWWWPVTTLAMMSLALMLVHLLPRTTDSYYNALMLPLLAVAAGAGAVRAWPDLWNDEGRAFAAALLVGVLLLNGALQARAVGRQGILDWPPHNRMQEVGEAVAFLRRYTEPGDTLLTFETHLALEADLTVPEGLEMSIFSYHPTWSDEQARRYQGVNNDRLLALLRSPDIDAVAMTQFDVEMFYGATQTIMDTLHEHYHLAATIPHIGPHLEPLYIYLPPQFADPAPQTPAQASLSMEPDRIRLLGYDLAQRQWDGEPYVQVALYWRAEERLARSYTGFVQLLDETGRLVVGWDNPPCERTCPTESWQAGEVIRDEYWLSLAGVDDGERYRLVAGMYASEGGERLVVNSEQGGEMDVILLDALAW